MLIASLQPSKVLILLVASCLMWIGLLSLAVAFFLGATGGTVWIVAGALLIAFCLGVAVMVNEFRCAIDLPDDFNEEADTRPSHDRSVPRMIAETRLGTMTPAFPGRGPLRLRCRQLAALSRKPRPRGNAAR